MHSRASLVLWLVVATVGHSMRLGNRPGQLSPNDTSAQVAMMPNVTSISLSALANESPQVEISSSSSSTERIVSSSKLDGISMYQFKSATIIALLVFTVAVCCIVAVQSVVAAYEHFFEGHYLTRTYVVNRDADLLMQMREGGRGGPNEPPLHVCHHNVHLHVHNHNEPNQQQLPRLIPPEKDFNPLARKLSQLLSPQSNQPEEVSSESPTPPTLLHQMPEPKKKPAVKPLHRKKVARVVAISSSAQTDLALNPPADAEQADKIRSKRKPVSDDSSPMDTSAQRQSEKTERPKSIDYRS